MELCWCLSRPQGNAAYTCSCLWQFALQEEKRQKAERLHQQQKHESQMKDMQAQCESNTNELQHLQVLRAWSPELPVQVSVSGDVAAENCQELMSPCSCLERFLLPCLDVELRALNVSAQGKSCLTTGCAVPAASWLLCFLVAVFSE